MQATFAHQLDALAAWRRDLERDAADLKRHLKAHDLDSDKTAGTALEALRQRLASDRLSVAFVAEFSRGKSELINAIFFADTGRRVLPATPGRTTMCPVEIGFEASMPPQLALLPIETRLDSMPLVEWRNHPDRWTIVKLDVQSPQKLSSALAEVMRTKAVSIDTARDLGLWHDDRPDDNPSRVGDGLVEVPAWRHAAINYPHPLLRRGLVVLDTPGLNAIGAEPELTLSLLPSTHAVVFILGADTGVTKSDLAVWREHLCGPAMTRFVALNKIDTLADPLLAPRAIELQIESQRQATAAQLEIDAAHVFPVSARRALTARVDGRTDWLPESGLPALERALGAELLPKRHEVLAQAVTNVSADVERVVSRRIGDWRRQLAEQTLELRGLRGKSDGKTVLMARRVEEDAQEFERSGSRIGAIHAIHARLLRGQLLALASDSVRDDVKAMQDELQRTLFSLGAKKAFVQLFERLRARLDAARQQGQEAYEMLDATFRQLNTEFGFALALPTPPSLAGCGDELAQLEANYSQYLGLSNAFRLRDGRFMDQFRRMLLAKLRVAFENAAAAVEQWHKNAASQLDAQWRERRAMFKRRQETLTRIAGARDELETRITDLQDQDLRWQSLAQHTQSLVDGLRRRASAKPRELDEIQPAPAVSEPAADAAESRVTVMSRPGFLDTRPAAGSRVGFVQRDSHAEAQQVDTRVLQS